ncbi:hypothetical protein B9Z55_027587 [Caenorhabditis nigoni]|uniref:Uncharacterized protein n=1 Tax=Caenorhabditis nigoni TaxID=1611254 RepID=A0A2G5SFS5_9PELO|nr:hypothetical protein B9Z55_027587 [Caenorhabditis nigoni]
MNIAKFPDFLAPHTSSNVTNYAQESTKALNKLQLYLKTPSFITDPHLKNSGLGSVDHNLGPEPCLGSLAKAERELQIIQRKQMNLTGPVAPESVQAVERCFGCVDCPPLMFHVLICWMECKCCLRAV